MGEIFAKSASALLQVTLVGLVLGAGLPALFALGMKAFSAGRATTPGGHEFSTAPSLANRLGAGVCFGIVVLAALFGIAVIVFGKKILGGH